MRNVTILLAVAAVLALAVPASAAVLIETDFSGLDVGLLDGQSTVGTGLTGTWSGGNLIASNISYSNGEVSIDGGANALNIVGTTTTLASLTTAAADAVDAGQRADGDTLYMGMLFHLTGDLPDSGDYVFGYLGAGSSYCTNWGAAGDAGDGGNVYGNIGGGSIRAGKYIEDETLYIVAKMVSNGTAWVSMKVFYNPDDLNESSASNLYIDVPANDQDGTLSDLGFRSVGITGAMDIGLVSIGETWGDVVVPEPATMVLLGIGGIGVLIRRRRR